MCHRRVLRHGRSLANEKGIIVSTYENGLPPNFGLHETGKQQALQSGWAPYHLETDIRFHWAVSFKMKVLRR